MFEWLHPTNLSQEYILYASQITFELMFDEECVQSTPSEDCFTVNTWSNGQALAFRECHEDPLQVGCSFPLFKKHLANIWYDGADADDLNLACYQPTKPYGQNLPGFL